MKLVSYQGAKIHPECLSPLEKLDVKGKALGWRKFKLEPCRNTSWHPLSAANSGREFHIQTEAPIESLWSAAIPLGFIPWNRYPVEDENSHLFHFYGKWASLIDFLHSEGKGEHAWSSFCCASMVEVGLWEGDKPLERELQMHLHRLGIHCGPVDGIIGERTLKALKTLGVSHMSIQEVIDKISSWEYTKSQSTPSNTGYLMLGGHPSQVFTSGGVKAVNTGNGYTITIEGEGRIIIELE